MKKKILCSLLFLTILFCISYSQTHPFTFRSSAEENADAESDISSEGTVSPGGQYTAEFSPDATPEPLENTEKYYIPYNTCPDNGIRSDQDTFPLKQDFDIS